MRDHDKINDEPESARTDVALKGAPQAQEDENGVFPASVWVVEPSKFMAQLTSPYECFIRLIWAPLLFCFATYAQWVVMEEMEIWGLAAFVFTLPAICWSLAAILFTTEYCQPWVIWGLLVSRCFTSLSRAFFMDYDC
jgi:hypothetical protein